jgi:hypothetical protein
MASPRRPGAGPPRAPARRGRARAFRGLVLAALAASVAVAGVWSMTRAGQDARPLAVSRSPAGRPASCSTAGLIKDDERARTVFLRDYGDSTTT